jgi:hypothetical protein
VINSQRGIAAVRNLGVKSIEEIQTAFWYAVTVNEHLMKRQSSGKAYLTEKRRVSMSQDDRHDYRNLMRENEEPALPSAPHGRASDESAIF